MTDGQFPEQNPDLMGKDYDGDQPDVCGLPNQPWTVFECMRSARMLNDHDFEYLIWRLGKLKTIRDANDQGRNR